MKMVFKLLISLIIFTQGMQAHPTGHYHGFVEEISHLLTQAGQSHWLAIAAGIVTAAYFLRLYLLPSK